MNAKTISMVAYMTIIGWIIAYFQHKGSESKSTLASYHLEQGLGVFIFAVLLNIVLTVIIRIIPSLGSVISLVGILPLVLLILGIIAAANEAQKTVPLIGKFFEGKFGF